MNVSKKEEREYRLILPKWDNEGHKIKADVIRKYAREMSDRFGGVTIIPSVLGCWIDEEKNFVCEENVELVSGRDIKDIPDGREKIFEEDREFIMKLGERAGRELGQYSVYVTENIVKDISEVPGEMKKRLSEEKIGHKWFEKLI